MALPSRHHHFMLIIDIGLGAFGIIVNVIVDLDRHRDTGTESMSA
jgi:hypothetical protein